MSSVLPIGEIAMVQFSIADVSDNIKDSFVAVQYPFTKSGNKSYPEGVYDSRMGTTSNNVKCNTCAQRKDLCPGHAGHIKLNYPVQSPMFKDLIFRWLKLICLSCGALMVNCDQSIGKMNRFKTSLKLVKKAVKDKPVLCPTCGIPHLNIVRDKYDQLAIYKQLSDDQIGGRERIMNREIATILDRVSEKTMNILGVPLESHPRKFLLNIINVPANTIRPDLTSKSGSKGSSNDITMLLKALVTINDTIGSEVTEYNEHNIGIIDNLDLTYYTMVRGSATTTKKTNITAISGAQPSSLASRFPGKRGRIRFNIQGRRTLNSYRTVASGDPNNEFDVLGTPVCVARQIQMPIKIHSWNYDELMIHFTNRDKVYPGCTKIMKATSGRTYYVGNIRDDFKLEEGDILWRDLIDNDLVAFNRAPSLTPSSITCNRVKIRYNSNTMSFNPIVAKSLYGADFDGDEMMGHFPLTLLTQVEIAAQMAIGERFVSYQQGIPTIGSIEDTLIGTALFTKHGQTFSKFEAMRMFSNVPNEHIIFDKKNYTAHELISMILPNINYKDVPSYYDQTVAAIIKYNIEDISVNIEGGRFINGVLDKKSMGKGASGGIAHIIESQHGSRVAMDFVYAIQQIATMYLKQRGFSIGIGDMLVSDDAVSKIEERTAALIEDSRRITKSLNAGELIPPIGMTIEQYYEDKQINALNIADEFVHIVLEDTDAENNAMYQLINFGSKGSVSNFAAVSSAIGQQRIDDKRIALS